MGYSYRNKGQIKDFWPDDTDTEMYFPSFRELPMDSLVSIVKEKFGSLDGVSISAERIHTECLGHDTYVPDDYTIFIVVRKEFDVQGI